MNKISRYSDEKLWKELHFAVAANDGSAECENWLQSLKNEARKRGFDIKGM